MAGNTPTLDTSILQDERKHLEGLLKDRINFHLLFASLLLIGSDRIDDPDVKHYALIAGTVVSGLIALAVLRTHRLVQRALRAIRETQKSHPYTVFYSQVWLPFNANYFLILIPFILTGLFALLVYLG